MKSRHIRVMPTLAHRRTWRSLPWLAVLVLLLWSAAAAFAQQAAGPEVDPPARVGSLTHAQGSIVFAPQGENDWTELPRNRPLTAGDRLWSDRDARAELHLGSATLHIDGESHLGIGTLDERAAQFILLQGRVNARVRELAQGENFEVGTPNVAVRADQAGEYRIDVDPQGPATRVVVLSGLATVYGEDGQSIHLGAGQQASFAGRNLAQVQGAAWRSDDFAQWTAERNRLEDQSIAARHVPRGVVGYPQLDQYGTWSQDANYGAVWYPRAVAPDWAPYRQGRWEWVHPWGWTWIDDAPWGFAPFHYGRWAQIGARWAWVPGRMVARPVYSPGLVVFVGGAGARPGMGWYPLAPGEAWYPWYRTSPRYVSFANANINLAAFPRDYANHRHRGWVTAARDDDFRRGRRVQVAPSVGVQAAPLLRERSFAAPVVREQFRAQREQNSLQWQAERNAREQQRLQAEQAARRVDAFQARQQQEQLRQQQEAARQRGGAVQAQPAVPIGRAPERERRWERGGEDGRGRHWQRGG